MHNYKNLFYLICIMSLLWGGAVFASDGVLEINKACVNTGCFSGDAAGFPVTISASGSYLLTSSLSVGHRDALVIDITSDRVSLDLNGFAVTVCVGVLCGGGDGNHAIQAPGRDYLRIHNGVVQGAVKDCIHVGNHAQLQNLTIIDCGTGIYAGHNARISDVSVIDSASYGVRMGEGSLLAKSTVSGSGASALLIFFSGLVVDSVIRNNQGAISMSSQSGATRGGYHGNLITKNNIGNENQIINSLFLDLGGNTCGTDTVCP